MKGQFRRVFRQELQIMMADRTLPGVLGLLALLVIYGLVTGIVEVRQRETAAQAIRDSDAASDAANRKALEEVLRGVPPADPFANPVDPSLMGGGLVSRHAVLPSAPLGPLAFGQSDMLPFSYAITHRSRVNFMYDSEMENPWNLLTGHLDLSFVVTWLLPLLILAMSYNLLSAEREQGTLRILLSQPLHVSTLLAAKVAARAAVLFCGIAVLPAVILLLFHAPARSGASLAQLVSWVALVVCYGSFWFVLAAFVNAFARSSAFNALALTVAWAFWVLLLPLGLNMAVQAASPVPSRTELATTTRVITIQGLNRYNGLLGTDYRYAAEPEVLMPLAGKIEVPPRLRGMYPIQHDVDREIDAVLERFDARLAGQQRLIDWLGFLSPAIVVHEGVGALAGTGSARYLAFRQQVHAFHEAWKAFFDPRIREGRAFTGEDLAAVPSFSWKEPRVDGTPQATLRRAAVLLVPTVLLLLAAAWRLRSFRPD